MDEIQQFAIQTPSYTPGGGGNPTGMLWLTAKGEWTTEPLAALILTDWATASELARSQPYNAARVETRQTYIQRMPGSDEVETASPLTEHEKLVLRSPGYALFGQPRPDTTPSR